MTRNKRASAASNRLAAHLNAELKQVKIDGLSNAFRTAPWPLKLVWFVIFLCAAFACAMLIVHSIQEYMRYEVTSKIRFFSQTPSPFPVIMVCNMNPLTTDYADSLFAKSGVLNDAINLDAIQAFYKNASGRYLSDEQKWLMGNDFPNRVISCVNGLSTCDYRNFQYVFHPTYHNCYRFNAGFDYANNPVDFTQISYSGRMSQLSIELYAGLKDGQTQPSTTKVCKQTKKNDFLNRLRSPIVIQID